MTADFKLGVDRRRQQRLQGHKVHAYLRHLPSRVLVGRALDIPELCLIRGNVAPNGERELDYGASALLTQRSTATTHT